MSKPTQHPPLDDLEQIKETLEVGLQRRGDPLDGFVTFRSLSDAVLSIVRGGGLALGADGQPIDGPGGGIGPIPPPDFGEDDLSRPPRPRNVRARGINTNTIGVNWSAPDYQNHAYTEVFAAYVDSWQEIAGTFNAERPIEPGNITQYFMGRAFGSTFLHQNLSSTIPNASFEHPIYSIGGGEIRLQGDQRPLFEQNDLVYLTSDEAWPANGSQGVIASVSFNSLINLTSVSVNFELPDEWPATARLAVIPGEDELDEALEPQTIYYWVRFVSTAKVPGLVQGESGAPGQVMADPEEILNILTGRIRGSQLASDIAAPIQFVRGPIDELDDDGNRRWPSVRHFVEGLGEEAISSYDETLEQVFLGFSGNPTFDVIEYQSSTSLGQYYVALIAGNAQFSSFSPDDTVLLYAPPGHPLEPLANATQAGDVIVTVQIINPVSGGLFMEALVTGPGLASLVVGDITDPNDLMGVVVQRSSGVAGRPGVISAAAFVSQISGQADANGAWIQSMETWQTGIEFENDDGEIAGLEGVREIIAAIQSKALVRLGIEDAAVEVRDRLQFAVTDPEDPNETILVAANEAASTIYANQDQISQSLTFRAQQNIGGVLFAAGFGIGLESQPSENPVSTFAVAADEFAIMSAANNGRVVQQIFHQGGGQYQLRVVHSEGAPPGVEDGLSVGAIVSLTIPFGSPAEPLRGQSFEVVSRDPVASPGFLIRIRRVNDGPDMNGFEVIGPGHAIYPEQSIPFVVNTTPEGDPVVGIRGRLIVDGMITAKEIEVTELLRANEIWAGAILSYGLIETPSLIGQTIATPRYGGWAVRMRQPVSPTSKVLEFSRWADPGEEAPIDEIPDPRDPLSADIILNQENEYPQLGQQEPDDTSFWLDGQGRMFVRASVEIGGNARILNRDPASAGSFLHFWQSDNTFPMMIFPYSELLPGMPTLGVSSWNYTQSVVDQVRSKALFWVQNTGEAGFNTANDSIYMGDTPMEPPSGGGGIRVITRQDAGALTGKGKVWASVDFSVVTNRWRPEWYIGATYVMFLADAGTDYGGMPQAFVPTDRNGVTMPTGQQMQNLTGQQAAVMDTHFLIIRAQSAGADPGWSAYQQWLSNFGSSLTPMASFYSAGGPDHRSMQGIAEVPASGNYRLLIVAVERFHSSGLPLWGPIGQGAENQACIGLVSANMSSQQVSTRGFEGSLQRNSNNGGSPGSPPPANPDPSPQPGPPPGGSGPENPQP